MATTLGGGSQSGAPKKESKRKRGGKTMERLIIPKPSTQMAARGAGLIWKVKIRRSSVGRVGTPKNEQFTKKRVCGEERSLRKVWSNMQSMGRASDFKGDLEVWGGQRGEERKLIVNGESENRQERETCTVKKSLVRTRGSQSGEGPHSKGKNECKGAQKTNVKEEPCQRDQ